MRSPPAMSVKAKRQHFTVALSFLVVPLRVPETVHANTSEINSYPNFHLDQTNIPGTYNMKALIASIALSILTFSSANAADEFLGPWVSGGKEVLKITKEGEALSAEFIRENVLSEFEKVRFPATVKDGALIISGEQGDVSARFDAENNLLIIGGLKAFEKLSPEQAAAIIEQLEKKQ